MYVFASNIKHVNHLVFHHNGLLRIGMSHHFLEKSQSLILRGSWGFYQNGKELKHEIYYKDNRPKKKWIDQCWLSNISVANLYSSFTLDRYSKKSRITFILLICTTFL